LEWEKKILTQRVKEKKSKIKGVISESKKKKLSHRPGNAHPISRRKGDSALAAINCPLRCGRREKIRPNAPTIE